MTQAEKRELRALWDSTPKFVIEAGLSGNKAAILAKSLECMNWVADFQLKYKDQFVPFEGLGAIIGDSDDLTSKEVYANHGAGGNLHIVLDDENIEDEHIRFCLDLPDITPQEKECAEMLLNIPKSKRLELVQRYV